MAIVVNTGMPPSPGTPMNPRLQAILAVLRAQRGFDAERCLEAKIALLVRYFRRSALTTAVVGVSGGVDSAVVLGLLMRAARAADSPISRVVGVLAPYVDIPQGVSNQRIATTRGEEVIRTFAAERIELDLSRMHAVAKRSIDAATGIVGGPWADGQLVSNLRTPALYQVVTLLTQSGSPGVLVGTTTRDEGSYIGYFGKASDGLCDLQPISDLHKSEVYALARLLGVPASVVAAAPTGDIWDGRTDADLIGVPFVAVELYTMLLCLPDDEREALVSAWDDEARAEFAALADRIEQLHRENAHKYHGSSPAAHLDVYARAVPGGWRVDTEPVRDGGHHAFVNAVTLRPAVVDSLCRRSLTSVSVEAEALPGFGESALLLHGVLNPTECAALLAELATHEWLPVGIDGRSAGFDPANAPIGSWRLSYYSARLARALWTRIAPHLPAVRLMDDRTPTDIDDHPVWRAQSLNSLLRFIRYRPGGGLVPHYDSSFVTSAAERTLMSVVLGLTAGETRFIRDPQINVPRARKDYADWPAFAGPGDVALSVPLPAGSALIFDHRVLHDSAPITGETDRLVLRTDVGFVRCGVASERVFPARMLGMAGERERSPR